MHANSATPTIEQVRAFWDRHPLFTGEARHPTGSRGWFLEHEQVYINDCFAGRPPDPIFTRGLDSGCRLLDVGCGPGFWVRYFLRQGFRHVSACDLAPRSVELTCRSLELFGLDADVHVGNAEELPYAAGQFDHINCQGVLHHTPCPRRALEEFHRVLRPNGTLCFSVYHTNFLLRRPWLLKCFSRICAPFIKLKGRGREKLLASGRADEIVRMYDGRDNPLGRSYTLAELRQLVEGLFQIEEVG
ncbi:MAG TPA: class I SAM-dependent methyltransferase, partial [Gemmataceae bacterium]|nr:class I SAM-dependent methyltransferase [Gemmataceae bacterium]